MADLTVEELWVSYGNRSVLSGVDLEVGRGEIVGLLGRNGAGKTTLMSIIAGLVKPTSGRVFVGDVDVTRNLRKARSRLGLAPQELGIYPGATVRENLRLFASLYGLRGRAREAAIAEVAEGMAIDGLLDRPAGLLSGGEQRRVHTAAALLHQPQLLLLDEPTVGADVITRAIVLETVKERAESGAAVLYSTHYLHELDDLGAGLAVLNRGRVVARGSRAELLERVGTPAVHFHFDDPPPRITGLGRVRGNALIVPGQDTAAVVSAVLRKLGPHDRALRAIEVVKPSLADVFAVFASDGANERASDRAA